MFHLWEYEEQEGDADGIQPVDGEDAAAESDDVAADRVSQGICRNRSTNSYFLVRSRKQLGMRQHASGVEKRKLSRV